MDDTVRDLHILPKIRDGLSFVYLEHGRIDREDSAIALHDAMGVTPIPAATLALLMLGPGTTITHAAVHALADNGCLIVWCGEGGVRTYAAGTGETRSAARLLRQARLATDPNQRMEVVRRMYRMRFDEPPHESLTIQQIRGMEGIRVREVYARVSREFGIDWQGRNYDRSNWQNSDPANRALSAANSCLYGLCHAAIVSAGYSPALGFIHTGKMLSFVYDIADLYKTRITLPAAFAAAAEGTQELERRTRLKCRDYFRKERLLDEILPDIHYTLFGNKDEDVAGNDDESYAADPARPAELWDPPAGKSASHIPGSGEF
ncbi:MAG: type I-E CRISPR-associated endonuclease Cas1e [bacterium]